MAIVCGTDLSAASAGALAVACALAVQRGEREVVLVHVASDEGDAARARDQLDAQAAAAPPGLAVRAELAIGESDAEIVAFAETEGADLIVIAASSLPGGSLLVLGSTAERVIATTRVPVLAVRDPAPWLQFARGARPLRLLLALDESVTSELGVQWTHALRARGPVEVVLGAVYYPDDAAAHYGLHAVGPIDRDPQIEELLARDLVRSFGGGEGVTARTRRGLGRIGDHVIELAQEAGVDAIVVGTSQKTGLGRLGSVSSVVVHDAPMSVVCVPPSAQLPNVRVPTIGRTLVATDLSPFANRAVPFAVAMTPAPGEVHVVHVLEDEAELDPAELGRMLAALAPAADAARLVPHVVRAKDAATAIAQAAARLGVDAICIASHGRSGLTRALMGSVADRLLRATRKPVVVLRPG